MGNRLKHFDLVPCLDSVFPVLRITRLLYSARKDWVSYFQSLSRIPLSAVLAERHPFLEIYCFILCINFITFASFVMKLPFLSGPGFNLKLLHLRETNAPTYVGPIFIPVNDNPAITLITIAYMWGEF